MNSDISSVSPSGGTPESKPVHSVSEDRQTVSYKQENAVWYTSWTALNADTIPEGVNTVYLCMGKLDMVGGQPTIDGLEGAFANAANLKAFIQKCHNHDPPIAVKITIGGHGQNPDYNNCWSKLTDGNVNNFAQALVNFCHASGADGIDFDWEPDSFTQSEGTLVGELIKDFHGIDSNLQTSLCVNSGPSWQTQAGWVFDAAKDSDGTSAIGRLNIMAYYPFSEEEPWLESWEGWAEKQGLSPNQITVGMLSNATDLDQFAKWDKSQGFSTSLWDWDPSHEDTSNKASNEVWNIYHSSKR